MKHSARRHAWVGATMVALVLVFLASFAFLPLQKTHADQNGTKVMPLGDSITYGIGSSDGGGYRTSLWNDFVNGGYAINFVGSQTNGPSTIDTDNEGHPGYRIDQIASNIVAWLTTYQPQVVLLHIGTNDILQNYNVSTAPDRLSSLIDQITTTSPNATVIVAQIIPLADPNENSEVVTYNNAIPGIVQSKVAQGQHVYSVDMYDAVPSSELPDGIHPNDAGYTAMAAVWYNEYSSLFSPNTTPTPTPVQAGWTKCSDENGTCSFSGTQVVRYGANGQYFYQTATNSINCNNSVFGDPIVGTFKACSVAPVPPMSWTKCADENGTCTVSGTVTVAYGANGQFIYHTVTGSTPCNNATFTDPIVGTFKACYYQ